jgi:hypothetical protein
MHPAASLPIAQYSQISILLPISLLTAQLATLVEPSLAPGGALELRSTGPADTFASELRLLGLSDVVQSNNLASRFPPLSLSSDPNSFPRQLTAKKASLSSAPLSLKRPAADPSAAVPLRTSRAAKASLWAFTTSGASTPTIDESTLLTAADLERPTLVQREGCDVKKTRKACKDCSCGLREILLDEAEDDDLVAAGFGVKKSTGKKSGSKKMKSGVTSSCGSCYLGDAFRCASCPYLGQSPLFFPPCEVLVLMREL